MQQSTGPLAFSLRCLHRVGSRFLSFEVKALALEKVGPSGLRQSVPFCWRAWGRRPVAPAHHSPRLSRRVLCGWRKGAPCQSWG